jgi:hypothetical protein
LFHYSLSLSLDDALVENNERDADWQVPDFYLCKKHSSFIAISKRQAKKHKMLFIKLNQASFFCCPVI